MSNQIDIKELHWLLAVTQNIDVGIVVLDREYRVQVWNTFMENRSGVVPYEASNQSFFTLFPELNQKWFSKKVDNVITLGTPAFTIWEQRPYLVRFKNYQPITGREDFMYQNTTMFPLRSTNGEITHICLVIYDVTDVATNRHQLQAANTELHRLSSTDSLTEIFNHGHFKSMLKREFSRHSRYGSMASLVMIDIDHFKRVNDTYGHQAGDMVIRRVAEVIRKHARDVDVVGRYGGDEFAVVLPDTDKAGTRVFCERLREGVEAMEVVYEGHSIRCTLSLGVADLSRPAHDFVTLVEWADQALYVAKKNGRNQVSVYE
jgi:diguanylate cyclase (GGDEF)-like protein